MKKLYCFDFDGTLTKKDTMFLFLEFYNPSKFRAEFIKHIPLFVFFKLKLMEPGKVKENFISAVLKGEKKENLEVAAQRFFDASYPQLFRENALQFIENIDREHTKSFIVTASLDIWVKPFAEKFKMNLLATEALFENGIFTGKFAGKNCNSDEKVCRILTAINGEKFDKTIAFGDTDGDKPMLDWADEGHFAFFQ